jgi:hypothetical protein
LRSEIFDIRRQSSTAISRAAYVAMVESAHLGQSNDAAVLGRLDGAWLGRIFVEREVRPRAMVVAEVAAQTAAEVLLVKDDDVLEKLAADGADHALGEGVLPRGSWCRKDLRDAHALHTSPKLGPVDTVAIAEEEARRRVIGESVDNLLRRPSGRWGIVTLKCTTRRR